MSDLLLGFANGVLGSLCWAAILLILARAGSAADPKRAAVLWLIGLSVAADVLATLYPALRVKNALAVGLGYTAVVAVLAFKWLPARTGTLKHG